MLDKLKITRKKMIRYRECDQGKRNEFKKEVNALPQEKLLYVDEVGIDQYLYRPYARALIGQSVYGKISGRTYKRTSIVSGYCLKKVVSPLQYSGTMDSVLFLFWFVTMLLPNLTPGYVIVMDNARFHQKKALHEAAEKAGCRVLFLPPYSPDLNPIENLWAWLKSRLRKILPLFDSLDDAITDCFNLV